jgi:Fe-S cluster assembly protein SufB
MSEAVQEHPELVRKYIGSVVPHTIAFTLNSAVLPDGSFVTFPKACCPMSLTYSV